MTYRSPLFTVVTSLPSSADRLKEHVYLVIDRWDDWGKFCTQFSAHVVDSNDVTHSLGSVKIGEVGLKPDGTRSSGSRSPTLPGEFDQVSEAIFSLGQGENYYETLNLLPEEFKKTILRGLRDCAFDLSIFENNINEEVMYESLLRDIQAANVRNRYHRLALGDAVLTRFEFSFEFPSRDTTSTPPTLTFEVVPHKEPPTNIHVIIGRNGVGKTHCVQNIIRTVLENSDNGSEWGKMTRLGQNSNEWEFAGLVYVSFSAFDDFDIPTVNDLRMRVDQVGLRQKITSENGNKFKIKTPKMLAQDFVESLSKCRNGPREGRWRKALETLETDRLFQEADARGLLDIEDESWKDLAKKLFKNLSSGHAIVLLTITKLIEAVDERTLVILDEPEGHLHPPLLAAFVRTVADLLGKRNGIALIATHSPVVLQEVPMSCVWKLRRSGATSVAERPSIETFGENVGVLTNEVFGLEVTRSGFHKLLKKAVSENYSYEEILEHFSNQLGSEARAIARGLIAANTKDQ